MAILDAAGFQVRYQSTSKKWKKALKEADLLVAAGGDGTVAEVMLAAAEAGVPVAILPLGTANNIGRSLGIVGDAREIADGWDLAAARQFSIWSVHGESLAERFFEGVGGGAFAETISRGEEAVDNPTHLVGNAIDRALTLVRQVLETCEPAPWTVEVDGRDLSGSYLAVEAMNIRFCGPSIPIAQSADAADDLLDVVLVGEADRQPLIDYVSHRLQDASGVPPRLPIERGRKVCLVPPAGPLRIDDRVVAWKSGELVIAMDAQVVRIL